MAAVELFPLFYSMAALAFLESRVAFLNRCLPSRQKETVSYELR